jgi:fatty-acid desaturase
METAEKVDLKKQFSPFMLLWLAIISLGSFAAIFTFSWWGLGALVVLFFLTGWVGICAGYHRSLAHPSIQINRCVHAVILFFGTASGQGPPKKWAAKHRKHHHCSDTPDDPHTPHHHGGLWRGLLYAHAGWLLWDFECPKAEWQKLFDKYLDDWKDDPIILWLSTYHVHCHVFIGILLVLTGWLIGGWYIALSMFIYGWPLRIFCVSNVTWAVNSVTHVPSLPLNYRNPHNEVVRDHSCNNVIVALLAGGEGWHANHHSFPTAANHGQVGFEKLFDPTFWLILRPLRFFGLATDLKKYVVSERKLITI